MNQANYVKINTSGIHIVLNTTMLFVKIGPLISLTELQQQKSKVSADWTFCHKYVGSGHKHWNLWENQAVTKDSPLPLTKVTFQLILFFNEILTIAAVNGWLT